MSYYISLLSIIIKCYNNSYYLRIIIVSVNLTDVIKSLSLFCVKLPIVLVFQNRQTDTQDDFHSLPPKICGVSYLDIQLC